MENKKNIIGEVSVEVKAGLSVDYKTFKTCMNLVAIYAMNGGFNGMVVRFDDNLYDGYTIKPLFTEDDTMASFLATPDVFKKKESED